MKLFQFYTYTNKVYNPIQLKFCFVTSSFFNFFIQYKYRSDSFYLFLCFFFVNLSIIVRYFFVNII